MLVKHVDDLNIECIVTSLWLASIVRYFYCFLLALVYVLKHSSDVDLGKMVDLYECAEQRIRIQ